MSGDGIQVSSHRYGSFVCTVVAVECVLADGTAAVCSPCHNAELYWGVVATAGTVAIVTAAQIRLMPAAPLVRSVYTWFSDPSRFALL